MMRAGPQPSLPAGSAARGTPADLPGSAPRKPRSLGPLRVLIVDDDPMVSEVLAMGVRSLGGLAVITSHATAFLEAFDRLNPSHVVVDLFMPDTDGMAVLRMLAARRCAARVIVTSGHEPRLLDVMLSTGCSLGLDMAGQLAKPFRLGRLTELLTGTALGRLNASAADCAGLLSPLVRCADGSLAGHELILPDAQAGGADLADRLTQAQQAQGLPHALLSVDIALATLREDTGLSARLAATVTPHATPLLVELGAESLADPTPADAELCTRMRLDGFGLALQGLTLDGRHVRAMLDLPFSTVKLAPALIHDALGDSGARRHVQALAGLAASLGLQTVAEGVDSAAHLDLARSIGADLAQGALFAPAALQPAP
jgi:CheY-like chemotaxis protein